MLLIVFSICVICLFVIIIIFAFPQFSPIPYFPSNQKDIPNILKALQIHNNQTIIDLGAGDGIVIFEGARLAYQNGLNTRFFALEINPVLIGVLYIRRLFHPNKKNISIIMGNMFSYKFSSLLSSHHTLSPNPYTLTPTPYPLTSTPSSTTFYLYISPWLIEKATYQTTKEIPHARYVSYYYPIKKLKEKRKINGVHPLYCYEE